MRLVKKSSEKEATCQHCKAVMFYESKDIRDYYYGHFVVCPECGKYVKVEL